MIFLTKGGAVSKSKNVMVLVARINKETRQFDEMVIHVNECNLKDKVTARCPECQERVVLMLSGNPRRLLHQRIDVQGCTGLPKRLSCGTWT